MYKQHYKGTGWRQLAAAAALMPLLAVCSSGHQATATAAASPAATPAMTGAATIYINEVLAHTDEPQIDSVELFNPNATPVDLSGWCLSDDEDEPDRFCIAQATIPAGGYRVFTADDFPFRLKESGENLYLYAPASGGLQQVDGISFGASPNGVSLGRYVTSTGAVDFPLQRAVTLGGANAGPRVPPVVIAEIMYQPAQGPEYLVLVNSSSVPVPLYDPYSPQNRWLVAGIGNNNGDYTLPEQLILQAGESIVLTSDPAAFAATYPANARRVFGPFAGKLDNDGERIALQAPQPPETNGAVAYADMDVVQYGIAAPWPAAGASGQPLVRISPQSYGNDPRNWRAGDDATALLDPKLMLPLVTR